jgi:hypothetical protein
MKNETSIIVFDNDFLQKHFKILSVKGKIRIRMTRRYAPDVTKYHFDIESLYKGVPVQFSIQHLTEDEYIYSSATEPIIFISNNVEITARNIFLVNNNRQIYSNENHTFINSFNSGELEELIFNAVYSYFEQSNQYKLLNMFFNAN